MTWIERRWEGDPEAMSGRKARQSFTCQVSEGGYDRQYAADELFDLIEAYEHRVARV